MVESESTDQSLASQNTKQDQCPSNLHKQPESGDVLEFFDGEGYVSGTFQRSESRELGEYYILQVGEDTQAVHTTDTVSILREAS